MLLAGLAFLSEGATPDGGTLTGIAVLITALGSALAAFRASKRVVDEKKAAQIQKTLDDYASRITELESEVKENQKLYERTMLDLVDMKSWSFAQRLKLSEQGITLPALPPLRSEEPRVP